ncbi:hypothetical protein D9757_002470 [Collybiopsis confluens]|uniref:Ubiquitin-like protease family profile domain-containing protein n=1 Tax=Collybiopsis confluens TaxID=2823264 RepID=A0A8H5HYG6_9AGAR|nr:hypothetical protein D9757_002470 [Collybiopsis confluens]
MMVPSENEVDTSLKTPFERSKWIGLGIKWSDQLPKEVQNARDELLRLPVEDHLPTPLCSVEELLQTALPEQSSKLYLTQPKSWFKAEKPFTPVSQLVNRPLPSETFLREALKHVGQAMLDGNLSITDPNYNEGQDRFPIHALSYMLEALQMAKGKERWARGEKWLTTKGRAAKDKKSESVIQLAKASLAIINWNSSLPFTQLATTLDLPTFLGTTWLKDDHIDMMLEVLRDRLVQNRRSDVILAPMAFSWMITAAAQQKNFGKKGLNRYKEKIHTENIRRLYFPLNVNGNHWIAGCIDFKDNCILYGDSLAESFSAPTGFLLELRKWFKHAFGRDVSIGGDKLQHARQDDTYSCGVCAVNTIAHAVFGDELWLPQMKVFHRVQWFLSIREHKGLAKNPEPLKVPTKGEQDEGPGDDMLENITDALSDFNFPKTPRSHIPLSEILNPVPPLIAQRRMALDALLNPAESDADVDSDEEGQEAGTGAKRPFPDSETDEGDALEQSEVKDSVGVVARKKQKSANVGISRTATRARNMNAEVKERNFEPNQKSLNRWKSRLCDYDPRVGFNEKDPSRIKSFQHSLCNTWHEVKCPYDTTRFFEHLAVCTEEYRKKKKSAGMDRITSFFGTKVLKKPTSLKTHLSQVPCPGWTDAEDPRTFKYLARSGARGGGAPSIHKISQKLYQKPFREISPEERRHCLDVQEHSLVWLNQHSNLRVFHRDCSKQVPKCLNGRTSACCECLSLRSNPRFQAVLNRKTPLAENIKYTNRRWRNELLGHLHLRHEGMKDLIEAIDQKHSPLVQYTMGMLSGKYKDAHLAGLIEALVIRRDREQRGVGLQGIKYPPAWDELCHLIQVSSPKTYRLLEKYFPMQTERSWRMKVARQPRFPPDINKETFQQLRAHLQVICYRGQPCSLCCDDTKLMPRLRVYYDSRTECHYVVGSDQGPIKVANPDELEQVLKNNSNRKATKIRLWVLTPCIPGTTPILLAAKAITAADAGILTSWSMEIIRGLIREGVNVISYACDGTEVERSVQRRIISQADCIKEYIIPSPCAGGKDITARFAFIDNQPLSIIQDSKHALKTFRNNIFSGARLLCFGNYVAVYEYVRQVAHEDRSPIYIRDVERLDRQDDAAASRLFSADMLEYVCDTHPEHVLLIILLFVFGELIDAFQNRHITHHKRVRMVLRARYFIDQWETFLSISQYRKSRFCLSREALDIASILIEALIALIIIHRDYQKSTTTTTISPLIPWLHSSEPAEHAFGDSRLLIGDDFDFLDFIYGVPKVRLQMAAAVHRGKVSDPKARARGYQHTYFDMAGIDLVTLGTFPTDEKIQDMAQLALGDVESCISLLGMTSQQFQWARQNLKTLNRSVPSFATMERELESWGDHWDKSGDAEEEEDAAKRLEDIFALEEDLVNCPNYTKTEQETVKGLLCAGMSLVTQRMIEIHELANEDTENEVEAEGRDFEAIHAFEKAVAGVKSKLPDELSKSYSHSALEDVDFSVLVNIRRQNQTLQAAMGTRTSTTRKLSTNQTLTRQIVDRYNSIRRKNRDQESFSAGQSRAGRWMAIAPKGDQSKTGTVTLAGNSANAEVSAAAVVKRATVRRHGVFKEHLSVNDHRFPLLSNARVTLLCMLQKDSYGIIWLEGRLFVGKVIALYEKTGGKNGKYASVTQASSIAAAAYIDLQVFEPALGRRFTNITASTALFNVNQFAKIPSQQFLVLVQPSPASNTATTPTVMLQEGDYDLYNWLKASADGISAAMTKFRKRSSEEDEY